MYNVLVASFYDDYCKKNEGNKRLIFLTNNDSCCLFSSTMHEWLVKEVACKYKDQIVIHSVKKSIIIIVSLLTTCTTRVLFHAPLHCCTLQCIFLHLLFSVRQSKILHILLLLILYSFQIIVVSLQ